MPRPATACRAIPVRADPPPVRFTLRQLEVFTAACETGSVTLAAERCFITQPAASSAIAQLERALDVQLLIRQHAHGIAPTDAGRALLVDARNLLRAAADLDRLASALGNEIAGTLHLGCLVTLAPLLLPALSQRFLRVHPAVRFAFVESGQDELLRLLQIGDLAMALTYDLGIAAAIAFEPLVSLPPRLLVSADHRFAEAASIEIRDLDGEPFVLLDLPISRDYFEALFREANARPEFVYRSPRPDVVRAFVANGVGCTIVNARAGTDVSLDGRRLCEVPIEGLVTPPLRLGMASVAGARETRLAAAFREHCRAHIDPDGSPGLLRR